MLLYNIHKVLNSHYLGNGQISYKIFKGCSIITNATAKTHTLLIANP